MKPKEQSAEVFWTAHRAAEFLGCALRSLYNCHGREGWPKGYRLGKRGLRFKKSEVEALMTARAVVRAGV